MDSNDTDFDFFELPEGLKFDDGWFTDTPTDKPKDDSRPIMCYAHIWVRQNGFRFDKMVCKTCGNERELTEEEK